MATDKRVLYHWTHVENLTSIEYRGLDPAEATGELYAVWGCEQRRTPWAKDHVASRHKWPQRDLVLLKIEVRERRVYRTCWDGVFYTPETIPPESITIEYGRHNWITLAAYLDTTDRGTVRPANPDTQDTGSS